MPEGRPIAFDSRKLNETKRCYFMHKKEITIIVHYLRVWRHYLLGTRFTVYIDNVATSCLQGQKRLTPKQIQWHDYLAEFDFILQYKLRKINLVVDALSRIGGVEDNLRQRIEQTVATLSQAIGDMLAHIKEETARDATAIHLLKQVREGVIRWFWVEDGVLYTKENKPYVSKTRGLRQLLLKETHDSI